MRAMPIVQRFVDQHLGRMHSARRRLLCVLVGAAMQGHWLSLTRLARAIAGPSTVKAAIKRAERLIGNAAAVDEAELAAQALLQHICRATRTLIVAVDWSSLQGGRFVELRAAVSWPGGGRSLPVYQEVHPQRLLGNRAVESDFLDKLHGWVPAGVRVIVVADAGFRRRWFGQVARVGWEWVGRVRSGVSASADGQIWQPASVWFAKATAKATRHFGCLLTKRNPLECGVVLYRRSRQWRRYASVSSRPSLHRASRQMRARSREREPWMLVHSPSMTDLRPDEIVAIYGLRMQIEESFRDSKSPVFGMGFEIGRSRSELRLHALLLIATLALFFLWHIGQLAEAEGLHKRFKLTTRDGRELSLISLGRLLCQSTRLDLSRSGKRALVQRFGTGP